VRPREKRCGDETGPQNEKNPCENPFRCGVRRK
jgi:hypothetical protein